MPHLVYWEIPSTDVAKSSAFHAALFGWTMTPSTNGYMMFETDGGVPGGIEKCDAPVGRGIRIYIGVDDIPATLAKAQSLGGTLVQEKTAIGGEHGHWGAFEDPGGSCVGLWSKT